LETNGGTDEQRRNFSIWRRQGGLKPAEACPSNREQFTWS
jgi:hypothetical protein